MKIAYFVLWALLSAVETVRLRRQAALRRELTAFWLLAAAALAAGVVYAALPDGAGLAEWLLR